MNYESLIMTINQELKSKKMGDLYSTINSAMSEIEILNFLTNNLEWHNHVINEYGIEETTRFDNFLYKYIEVVKSRRNVSLREAINNFTHDIDWSKHPSSGNVRPNSEAYGYIESTTPSGIVIYSKSHNYLSENEMIGVLNQFKKAYEAYYNIYEGKIITATTANGDNIQQELKEDELLHILGITRKQALEIPEFVQALNIDITNNQDKRASSILKKIYDDIQRNQNLLTLQLDSHTLYEIFPWAKVRQKTLTFEKTASFNQPKLLCPLAPGKRLGRSGANVATISRNGVSASLPWGYLGGVYNPRTNYNYTNTLQNDSARGQLDKFNGQVPTMIVETTTTGSYGTTTFSPTDDELRLFFDLAIEDFGDGGSGGMNFAPLAQVMGYNGPRLVKGRTKK